jgi:CheY-like chemotaxis protein
MPTHRRASHLFGAAAEAAAAASRSLGTGPAAAVLFWGNPPEVEVVRRNGVPDDVCRALAAAGGRHLAEAVRRQAQPMRVRTSDLPAEAAALAASLRGHELTDLVVLPLHGERGVLGCLVAPQAEDATALPVGSRWREASRILAALQVAAGAAALRMALAEEGGASSAPFDGVVVVDRWERVLFADGVVLDNPGWEGPDPFGRSLDQLPGGTLLSALKTGTPDALGWAQHLFPPIDGRGIPVEMASVPAGLEDGGDSGSRIVLVRDLRADGDPHRDSASRMVALVLRLTHAAAELTAALPAELAEGEESVIPASFLDAARSVPALGRAVLERVLGPEGVVRCDLNQATSEALDRVRDELGAARVSVFSFLRPGLGTVPADALELRHVLRTLIGKARRSLRASGGTLTARTWSEEGFACLAISDDGTGVGLSKDATAASFQPLFADEQDGLDAELDAVKATVDRWGGRFLVEQRPGVWNRYTLMLRESFNDARRIPRPARPRRAAPVKNEAGLHVLVVDDNAALRSVVKRYLERRGHQVTEAVDGEQALGLCGGREFDRLIVDVGMPNKTGPEFYAGLEDVAPVLRTRTFFMTGGGLEEHDERFVFESGRPAIMKPFDLSELAKTVEAAV